jgi:hypothetical protein
MIQIKPIINAENRTLLSGNAFPIISCLPNFKNDGRPAKSDLSFKSFETKGREREKRAIK